MKGRSPSSRGEQRGEAEGCWCPGTELNRRRQPFQGCALPPELPGHVSACGLFCALAWDAPEPRRNGYFLRPIRSGESSTIITTAPVSLNETGEILPCLVTCQCRAFCSERNQ